MISPRARIAIAGAAMALAVPAVASAANRVVVTAPPINRELTATNATTTVSVRNTTNRTLTGLTLAVPAPRGVQVTIVGARRGAKVRALPALRARASTRVMVRVRRNGPTAPKTAVLTPKVVQNRRTIGSGRLVIRKPAPTTLTGRYFWGSQYTLNGPEGHTLYFTSARYVFIGDAKDAWPVCTAPTDVCKPYTYNARTNALVIDGERATLQDHRLTWQNQSHWELGREKAGARWNVVLTHSSATGLCPLYCSYFTEHLTFLPDGTFTRSSVASGTGPVVDWISVPNDRKGTYEVRANGTLRLAFADGTERIRTLGLFPDDGKYPANAAAGIVLGGDGYFDIRRD